MSQFPDESNNNDPAQNAYIEEIKTTPLFSGEIVSKPNMANLEWKEIFPQYGLIAQRLSTYDAGDADLPDQPSDRLKLEPGLSDDRLFLNINAPWSAFICGSQGSGKSHTLSCMLEMALMPSKLGELPQPLAAIVFHFDKFTGGPSSQPCEAAYLCSTGIPVRVLCSDSNLHHMTSSYSKLSGLAANAKKPIVMPLKLNEKQLNAERVMKLMAVGEKETAIPLYMEVGCTG